MELIRIEENNGMKAVSARELHNFLGSKQDFSTWIKNRIEKFDLLENIDYQAFRNFVECQNGIGGTTKIEYALSIDAAKELSMVEGNERGKQARRYFIECEKLLSSSQPKPLSQGEIILQMAQYNLQQEKRIAAIESKTDELYQIQQENEAGLKELPVCADIVPDRSLQDTVRMQVTAFAQSKGISIQTVWNKIYQTLEYNYGVRVKSCKKLTPSESWLAVAARKGHLEKMHAIISNLITSNTL